VKIGLRHRLVYWMARAATGFAAVVPDRVGYGVASVLGRIYFRCSPRRRGHAMRMLRNAFPGRSDAELAAIGARATGNLFKVPLDMAKATRVMARGDVLRFVDVTEAKMPPPPFLGATPHLGSWEIAAVAVAAMTGNAHVVVRVFKNPLLERWLAGTRAKAGLTLHPRRGGIRGLARALAQGSVGLQAVDQNQRLRGVFAPFFGELASTERSAVSLALRKRYPIVVGRCERVGPGFRFRLCFDAPFVPRQTGDKQRDLLAAVTEVNRRIERHVLACPEQYVWIHDRYRTRPPAAGSAGSEHEDEASEDS
jgi:KDO2-lipid IV(A) lauroyltransferase